MKKFLVLVLFAGFFWAGVYGEFLLMGLSLAMMLVVGISMQNEKTH